MTWYQDSVLCNAIQVHAQLNYMNPGYFTLAAIDMKS